jgi:TPR repeat protein
VGQGVEKNDAKAVEWMRKAAVQGYFLAQLSLGVRYADGNGVPRDLVEGFTWLSLGAQGLVVARQRTSQSEMKAEDLKRAQAASRPFEDAALQLFERLKTELTPEQMAEAQKRIATFAEKTNGQP